MSEEKLGAGRSPAYPFINLEKAMDRANAVYKAGVGQKSYPPGTFYKVWELGAKSSGARQTMAALNHYGIVDYDGRGKDRKVFLTDNAVKVIQDVRPDSVERDEKIKEIALTPTVYRALYQQFPHPMPDDVFVLHHLISELGYNEGAAGSVLKDFKATIHFAKLDKPDNMPPLVGEKAIEVDADLDGNTDQIEVGDLIQGTVGGLDVFPKGAKVLGFSDDKNWIFHDFSNSPLEYKDATIMQKAEQAVKLPPEMPPHLLEIMRGVAEKNAPDSMGEFTVLSSGKVKSGHFELRVSGEMNSKDMARMMKILEVQMSVLQDEDDDASSL